MAGKNNIKTVLDDLEKKYMVVQGKVFTGGQRGYATDLDIQQTPGKLKMKKMLEVIPQSEVRKNLRKYTNLI